MPLSYRERLAVVLSEELPDNVKRAEALALCKKVRPKQPKDDIEYMADFILYIKKERAVKPPAKVVDLGDRRKYDLSGTWNILV